MAVDLRLPAYEARELVIRSYEQNKPLDYYSPALPADDPLAVLLTATLDELRAGKTPLAKRLVKAYRLILAGASDRKQVPKVHLGRDEKHLMSHPYGSIQGCRRASAR
jgi:hypothetical protein